MTPWIFGVILLTVATVSETAKLPTDDIKNVTVSPDMWFEQYLDHYNICDNRMWKQRYLVIKDCYKEGSPVFLLLGGEWEIYGDSLLKYAVTAYGKKYRALILYLEHRFYGKSHPTSDVSTEKLLYLSTDQALADTAYFIKGMNVEHELPTDTKWIVFGGSYAANLAAWMRDKYSHLVYAAVADSGPVLAKVNFYDYMNVVKDTLARCNPDCVAAIQQAHLDVKELLNSTEGRCTINTKFKLCDPIDVNNKKDVTFLLGYLAGNLAGVVQYNGQSDITVDTVCAVMLNTSLGSLVDRYAEVNSMILSQDEENCTDYTYDKDVEMMKNVSWDAEKVCSGSRQWYYQTCTEMGYYQTSCDKGQLFYEDIPLSINFEECKDIYGDAFDEALTYKGENRTNIMYGGLHCQATRVVYIYSEGDPWHALGNNETRLTESPVIYIKGASHCAAFYDLKDEDSAEVKEAWYKVQDIIGEWCT